MKNRTPEMQKVMEGLEQDRINLNRLSQKKKFLPYRIAWSNKKLDRDFGRKLQEDDILMCRNDACLYISNFQDKEEYTYIITLIDHVGLLVNPEFKKYETVPDQRMWKCKEHNQEEWDCVKGNGIDEYYHVKKWKAFEN